MALAVSSSVAGSTATSNATGSPPSVSSASDWLEITFAKLAGFAPQFIRRERDKSEILSAFGRRPSKGLEIRTLSMRRSPAGFNFAPNSSYGLRITDYGLRTT